jgi:septal ring factor EnvC (AmiA/AmiB activator)
MPYTRWLMNWLMKWSVAGFSALLLVLPVTVPAGDDDISGNAALAERDLADLRMQLQQVEQALDRQSQQRNQAQRGLREAEKSESRVRRRLNTIETELGATQEQLGVLQHRADETRAELTLHVAGLEQELRRAYILGRNDWLRAVLSQQDPVEVGRQLVYSSYFARERNELAETIRTDLDTLDVTLSSLDEEKNRLGKIQTREQERLAELKVLREHRSTALADINRGIASDSEQLGQLRAEMAELQLLVDELTRVLTEIPIVDAESFAVTRGRLTWPTDGRVVRRFGQSRADGRLQWDGVLLAAAAGDDVRAVHHGRIVYADWLQGMGLLVIIEHGNGYLSLYGHNQDVVVETGEWVTPDSVIAHVGDSGGQAVPGLYFEIRKDGKPIDPGGWIAK